MAKVDRDAGIYIVLSVADNGVVHAWGEGPVHDPSGEQVTPFANRTRARAVLAQMRRQEKQRLDQPGETGSVDFRVCKVLGIEPVAVEAKG